MNCRACSASSAPPPLRGAGRAKEAASDEGLYRWRGARRIARPRGQDRDHVVVGATPEQMLALGFTPVGKDFPVFLHPRPMRSNALARTERKTAPGYKGFVFHTDPR